MIPTNRNHGQASNQLDQSIAFSSDKIPTKGGRTGHILYRSTWKPDGIAGAPPAARVFLESPAINQIEDVAVGCVL